MAIHRFWIYAALGLIATSAAAQPLTLPEAQRRAVERSKQLVAQDSATAASRELAVAAGQLPDPVLKLGVDNLPVDGADRFSLSRDFMTMRRIGVMQEFVSASKRELRARRFEREADRSAAEKAVRLAAIRRDTAMAWIDRYYAEAMTLAIVEELRDARSEIVAAEAAYRGGRGMQADVIAAHSALVALEDKASELRRRASTARIDLARWIGGGADAPLAGKPDISAVRIDFETLEDHLVLHPQIDALVRQEEVAVADAKIAQANLIPDPSLELAYQQRGPQFSNMVSIGIAIPIQWDRTHRQDRELAAKLALVEQAKADREEMIRAHAGEVRTMAAEWQNGKERVDRYRRELLPLSQERTRAVLAAYTGGKSSLADVLAARRGEVEVRLQALQLELETARLWARLEFLVPEGFHP